MLVTVLFWGVPTAGAQVRAAALSGAYTAVAAGPHASAWNPANLALYDQRGIDFFSVHAAIGNNSYSLSDYREFNGAFWGEEEKQEILARIESSAICVDGVADASALGVAFGGWAFSTATRGVSQLALPKEYVRLVLYGNTVGETFNLDGAEGAGLALTEFRCSLARRLGDLLPGASARVRQWSAGLSVKFLQGWAYGEILTATGGVTTTTTEINGSGSVRSIVASGGHGFAADLGFAGPIGRGWVAGVAARDLLAAIHWTRGVEERTDTFEIADVTLGNAGEEEVVTETTTLSLDGARTTLPVRYSLGVARDDDALLIAFNLDAASATTYGASARLRASAGVEWRARSWMALRGGASLGGLGGTTLALGLGFKPGRVKVDLALHSWGTANPFSSKGLGVGLGFGLAL
jgi:hypothetical protein